MAADEFVPVAHWPRYRALKWVVFLSYVASSLIIGEAYPFSGFPMYTNIGDRPTAAVPVFRHNGEIIDLYQFGCFDGLDVRKFESDGVPCSLGHVIREAELWIDRNPGEGTLVIDYGWIWLRESPGGIVRSFESLGQGTACKID